jgi:gamma-glutamyltranspeptidase / glutathione hydrolase
MRRLIPGLVLLLVAQAAAREPVRARHAMVTAQEALAADAGVAVMQRGGNAVDAAVAIGFALAVTHPVAGNLGGGGFMLIRLADGRATFIDFRERAPQKASHDMYLDASGKLTRDSIEGWRASGVPGTVRGFQLAHGKYGRAKWSEVLAPAIELAAQGFAVSYSLADSLKSAANLSMSPESKRIFQNGGTYYEAGDRLKQPELARTMDRIAKSGGDDFYTGEIARRLSAAMAKNGGLITSADLESYRVIERQPLTGNYHGKFQLITAPPPSSGGIGLLQMMGMLEGTGYADGGAGSAASIHYLAEVMRRFFADRSEYMGDPDFVRVPLAGLLDPGYLARRAATIDRERATPSDMVKPGRPSGAEALETTHYNVVDAEGNAVAVTYTLNGAYGSGVTAPGLGFLLNNEMDDFAAQPVSANMFGLVQGEANAIQPNKRPLSSMVPTIILRDGRLLLLAGSPGGSRIPSSVLQVILNVIDFGMNAQDAVDAPRIHHQWQPDKLYLERGISPDTAALLKSRGYNIEQSENLMLGRVEAIVHDNGWLQGGSDGRGSGKAVGY